MSQALAMKEYLDEAGHTVEAVLLGTGNPHEVPDYFKKVFSDKLRTFRSPSFLRTPNKKGIYVGRTLLFNLLYSGFAKLDTSKINLKKSIWITLGLGLIFSFCMDYFGLHGWTKTLLLDFQNERIFI